MSEEGHIELISKMLKDAKGCIGERDTVQASEKLYKASEEAIKILAERFGLKEYVEAERKGRWTAALLFTAVRKLSAMVNPEIINYWDHAWFLHVEGFHEARLDLEEVKARVKFVEELVDLSKGD